MSKTENDFISFLNKHHIKYETQYIIKVPFSKSKTHKVDFYLPKYDLYIELKGFMTYMEVNKLKWLSTNKPTKKHFYILQVTSEDWVLPHCNCNDVISYKIKKDTNTQYEEILSLKRNKTTTKELSLLSSNRLKEYIRYMNSFLSKWDKVKY